jgi:hypothetical protein
MGGAAGRLLYRVGRQGAMPNRGVRHAPRSLRAPKRDEDMNLMEGGSSRKRRATLRFFDTLKSEHGDGLAQRREESP